MLPRTNLFSIFSGWGFQRAFEPRFPCLSEGVIRYKQTAPTRKKTWHLSKRKFYFTFSTLNSCFTYLSLKK